jgi:MSHA pilin protein MshA
MMFSAKISLSNKKNAQSNLGFTLIEVVIVVVILAIVAVVALPKFIDITKDAEQSVMKAQMASIKSASEQINIQVVLHPENLNNNKNRYRLNDGQRIRIRAGYPDGRWNNTFRYIVDLSNTEQVVTDFCDDANLDYCVRQKNSGWFRTRGYADPASRGRGFIVFPNGYDVGDQKCYSYYYNPNQNANPATPEIPITGVDFSGC